MLDSEPLQLDAFNSVLKRFDISVPMESFIKEYIGMRDAQICEKMIYDFSLPITQEDFVTEKRNTYLSLFSEKNISPTQGLLETINSLHKILPLAIASSSTLEEIEATTRKFGIRDKFTTIVSAHQVENGKPSPDVYLKAAEILGVPPHLCAVLEDTNTGIQSAKSAGMTCIAITTTYHSHEIFNADTIISTFDELLPVLQGI